MQSGRVFRGATIMAFETQVREGGAWRTGLLISGYDGGAWRDTQEVWAREAGAWRQVYVRSDPLTLTFGPSWSQGYAEDGHKIEFTFADDDMLQGDWDLVGETHGSQRAKGAMAFAITGFGSRTVASLVRVRLTVKSQYTTNGIYPRVEMWTNVLSSIPATFAHVHGLHTTTGVRTTVGNAVYTTMSDAVGNEFIAATKNTIVTHDFGDGTGSADKEYYRGTFYGETAVSGTEPKIEITADYI